MFKKFEIRPVVLHATGRVSAFDKYEDAQAAFGGSTPSFALYGALADGRWQHITDTTTKTAMVDLTYRLLGNRLDWAGSDRIQFERGAGQVTLPSTIVASLVDMAHQHVEDIVSGVADGTYAASENTDIESKRQAVERADAVYRATMTSSIRRRLPAHPGRRNVFAEILLAREFSTSVSVREPLQGRLDLVASQYLGGLGADSVISREAYDSDELLRIGLGALLPGFEFPDWEGRTIGALLTAHGVPGEPSEQQVLAYATPMGRKAGILAGTVTMADLMDVQELGETGWLLPSGMEIWFHHTSEVAVA